MTAVTICSDFGAQKDKACHCFHFIPHFSAMKWWDWMSWSSFLECWILSPLFHSPLSSRGSSVSLCFLPVGWCHLHIWGYWYFSLQSFFFFLLAILIPPCASYNPAFHMMCSARWCYYPNLIDRKLKHRKAKMTLKNTQVKNIKAEFWTQAVCV